MGCGFLWVYEVSAVGEGVGGYVEDAHDCGAGTKNTVSGPGGGVSTRFVRFLLPVAVAERAFGFELQVIYRVLLDQALQMLRVHGLVLDKVLRKPIH